MSNQKHTISSALRRVKGVAGEIAKVDRRITGSVVYKKAEVPTFSFEELKVKRKDLIAELVKLKAGIAVANATTRLPGGKLLITAVHELAQIKSTISTFECLPCRAQKEFTEIGRESVWNEEGHVKQVKVETPMLCAYTERAQVEELDKLRNDFAEINRLVEHANHETNLPVD